MKDAEKDSFSPGDIVIFNPNGIDAVNRWAFLKGVDEYIGRRVHIRSLCEVIGNKNYYAIEEFGDKADVAEYLLAKTEPFDLQELDNLLF